MKDKAILLIGSGFSKSIAQEMVKRMPPMSEETAKAFDEALDDYAKAKNPAFEPQPIPYTNPYKDIINLRTKGLIEPIQGFNMQKKFRKQNNRKHKKSKR